MLTPWDFIADLTNPLLAFLPRALIVAVLCAVVCAVVGNHVVLRGMAFLGDAVAHSVFPGIAVAFLMGGSLLLGGLVAGLVTAVLIAVLAQFPRVSEQNVIGFLMTSTFAAGIVIISKAPGYTGSLTSFLFGSIAGVSTGDVLTAVVATAVIVTLIIVLNPYFMAVAFERETARANGLPVFLLDLTLYLLVTTAVVLSVRSIGNILVLALLVTPPATARLLTERLAPMMVTSAGLGAGAAIIGLYLSWALDLPAGGTIVLVSALEFLLAWLFAPRHGVITPRLIQRRAARKELLTAA
ncbi:MAG: anchored repeat-type ABC transporter permease subunit [Actinomycetaceae bacterium]|nr:anchored repeat-type ABC transporter permease subunit [Arcanobacterium sp.]MDD7687623.1 anchored repeat-type ABC transporter permease subunit [Actinomycetaceae bacterium]MDY5273138.1 anchored repeat-type ABC transporter permease subunit [Arcanobacterium sp.]